MRLVRASICAMFVCSVCDCTDLDARLSVSTILVVPLLSVMVVVMPMGLGFLVFLLMTMYDFVRLWCSCVSSR